MKPSTLTRVVQIAQLAVLGLVFCSCSHTGTPAKAPATAGAAAETTKSVEYLFVQTAKSVTSAGDTLTLHDVNQTTLYFSDRPDRIVGHGATQELVAKWGEGKDSFAADPPNATLSVLEGAEIQDIVVVLQDPRLEGDDLTYTVKVLDGQLPESAGASSLFIDVIGMPLTPRSYAGAARRENRATRRAIRRGVY